MKIKQVIVKSIPLHVSALDLSPYVLWSLLQLHLVQDLLDLLRCQPYFHSYYPQGKLQDAAPSTEHRLQSQISSGVRRCSALAL